MHYYQFNIGDYASHTSRLTPLEDLAYRRMLDLYYLNEQPLNGFITDIAREIGLSEHESEVEYVLGKFFTKEVDTFSQKRIDLEIKKYKSNHKNKIKAGLASSRARQAKGYIKSTPVEHPLNTESTHVQQNINQEPRTKNHKPSKEIKTSRFTPPSVEEVFNYCNERCNGVDAQNFVDHYKTNGWKRGNTKIKDWKACVRTWEKNSKSKGVKKYSDVTEQNINTIGEWLNE